MPKSQAYPLAWPQGWSRTPNHKRKRANFGKRGRDSSELYTSKKKLTIADGVRRVTSELDAYTKRGHSWRVPVDTIVISSDLLVRKSDGLPASSQRTPEDSGVAVYFELDGTKQVIPCDRYDRIADNLAAVAATLSSLRALERHGTGVMERAFTGFEALPSPEQAGGIPWQEVLGATNDTPLEEVRLKYRRLRSKAHPDNGGTPQELEKIQRAWEQAQMELAP